MLLVRTVAEVETKDVGALFEERADDLAGRARRPERRDDFCLVNAFHERTAERPPPLGTTAYQDSAKAVDVSERVIVAAAPTTAILGSVPLSSTS